MKASSLTILYPVFKKKEFLKALFLFTQSNFLVLDITSFHGSKLQLHPKPFSNSQFLIAVESWKRASSCGLYAQG